MRPVSAAWESTIRGSHTMVVRATVCDTFQTGTSPTGTQITVMDGGVDIDGLAKVRSTLDLTTDGSAAWPRQVADLLAPYGNEVYVQRGVSYSDDLVELVGLGYFRIETTEQFSAPDGPIRITGVDRMQGIIDADPLSPIQFLSGTALGDVVDDLVLEVYPSATIEWDDNTNLSTLTRSVIVTRRFEFLDELFRANGKIWYWDHRGALTIKDLPSTTTPVFEVHSGRGGVLVQASRNLTRRGVYNAVAASGEGPDSNDPARGVAIDNNPNSPTYYYGRFGKVTRQFTSQLIGTDAQAGIAAAAQLRKQLGLPYAVKFGLITNAALEPFDPVSVRTGNDEGRETHVLETLSVPLTEGQQMTATTKEQTVILIGSA